MDYVVSVLFFVFFLKIWKDLNKKCFVLAVVATNGPGQMLSYRGSLSAEKH